MKIIVIKHGRCRPNGIAEIQAVWIQL